MDTKMPAAGLVAGLIALALAVAALVTTPGGAGDVRKDLDDVARGLEKIEGDIGRIEEGLAKVTSGRGALADQVRELERRSEKLSGDTTRLGRAVAEAAEKGSAAPAAGSEIDRAAIRELVAAELRAAFQRRPGGQPQAGGGQPQAGGGQRPAGRNRIAANDVPQVARDAAAKAVEGFEIDHAHPAGNTDDGRDIFEVDGRAGGTDYRVRVTSDGEVLESGARQRRGGRRGGQRGGRQGGNQPQPPAEGGDRF